MEGETGRQTDRQSCFLIIFYSKFDIVRYVAIKNIAFHLNASIYKKKYHNEPHNVSHQTMQLLHKIFFIQRILKKLFDMQISMQIARITLFMCAYGPVSKQQIATKYIWFMDYATREMDMSDR